MLPPYKTFPVLRSENILMREISAEDIDDIFEISFYNSKPASTNDEALEMLERINKDYQNGKTVHWGIAEALTNKIIGTCGYYRGFENETGELGCVLRSEFRGKGFMTEAMKLAIGFGFSMIGLKKIKAITAKENIRAVKLMERLGFDKVSENYRGQIEHELKQNYLHEQD